MRLSSFPRSSVSYWSEEPELRESILCGGTKGVVKLPVRKQVTGGAAGTWAVSEDTAGIDSIVEHRDPDEASLPSRAELNYFHSRCMPLWAPFYKAEPAFWRLAWDQA